MKRSSWRHTRSITFGPSLEVNGKDLGTEDRLVVAARDLGLPVAGNSDAHYWLKIGVRHKGRD